MRGIVATSPARPEWANWLLGGQLEGRDLQALVEASRPVRHNSRRTLLRAEEDRVVLLIRGAAKAQLVTNDGQEVITGIFGPGHAAGLLVALGHADAVADLTCLGSVDALTVGGPAFRSLVNDRPAIMAACLATVASQHAVANAERARFAGTCIPQRVACRLLELATHWGRSEEDGVHITLPLTQEELAAWSGASRESVAKVLQGMRARGVLRTGRRSLTILDLPRLRERCEQPARDELRQLLATLT